MARTRKSKWFGARVDPTLFKEMEEYTDAADISMGELVRAAVKEYIWAHPKPTKSLVASEPEKLLKPDNIGE